MVHLHVLVSYHHVAAVAMKNVVAHRVFVYGNTARWQRMEEEEDEVEDRLAYLWNREHSSTDSNKIIAVAKC